MYTKYQASIQFTSKVIAKIKIINISETPTPTQLHGIRCAFVVLYEK
jgi:hypothetical protein